MKHNITLTVPGNGETKHLVWITDLHLDAADLKTYDRFVDLIAAHKPDALLIGGDIGNGKEALLQLEKMAHLFPFPLFFVFGNHDFYYESIAQMRVKASALGEKYPHLHYLTNSALFPLSNHTVLIGHDGWSDGRAGDYFGSKVMLNDYFLIKELSGLTPHERLKKLNELGDEAAYDIQEKLQRAFKTYDHVIVLTHTPPFVEACYWGDHPSDENWSPHFVCYTLGQTLKEMAAKHPEKQILVLSGHTHTGLDVHILPNLRVLTGESVLGVPTIQGMIYVN